MKIAVEVQAQLSQGYRRVAEHLKDDLAVEANRAMGEEVKYAVVAHLRGLAGSRRNRFGAPSSGFLGQAADIAQSTEVRADAEGSTLSIRHPAVARAFRDIHIAPKNAKSLAIPVHAIAYNRRPRQIWAELHLFIAKGMIFMPQGKDQPPLALYALVRSVTQKQDRSLMPSDQEMHTAAGNGMRSFITEILKQP